MMLTPLGAPAAVVRGTPAATCSGPISSAVLEDLGRTDQDSIAGTEDD
jgi:hypothetical protein